MSPTDRTLDATGKLCPLPVILSAREMEKMEAGQVLELLGDDPAILEDIPAWCQETGHELVSIQEVVEEAGTIRCRIRKRE
jgi:tRNA 2-thiouridine synthesizing protein A